MKENNLFNSKCFNVYFYNMESLDHRMKCQYKWDNNTVCKSEFGTKKMCLFTMTKTYFVCKVWLVKGGKPKIAWKHFCK